MHLSEVQLELQSNIRQTPNFSLIFCFLYFRIQQNCFFFYVKGVIIADGIKILEAGFLSHVFSQLYFLVHEKEGWGVENESEGWGSGE